MVQTDEFATLVTEGPGFVRIVVSGPPTGARFRRLLERVVAESESRGISRVLVDGREISALISTTDKFNIGVAAGHALGAKIKLAVLGSPANVDHFFETVARNRGASVMAFTDENAALEWLVRPVATRGSPPSTS